MIVDPNQYVLDLIKRFPRVDSSVDVQVAMMDMYETGYGIFNHRGAKKTRPLASVAFHPAEDIITGSRLRDSALRYERCKIKKTLDMSFLEFISLPTSVIDELCDISMVITLQRDIAGAKTKDEVDRLMKELEGKK